MSKSETTETEDARRKAIKYFVNGEQQDTDERKLTVKEILTEAGFEPPSEWLLTRDSDGHEYKDENHEVELHEDERFTATFTGPTPTS